MRIFSRASCIVLWLLAFPGMATAQASASVEAVIMGLMTGIDQQDGGAIAAAFHGDAALLATTPDGQGVVAVSAADFAELHASGQFGGQTRDVVIHSIVVADDLIASAHVTASNSRVHYTYFLGFVRLNGQWEIRTFLQRSRPTA